jgi:hypothetical protein
VREVASGRWTFRCASVSIGRPAEYEGVADVLLKMEALTETRSGRQYVDRVHVGGDINEAGRGALKKLS